MAGPQHPLTLRSKGQRSNPNPKTRVRVLTFAMGMGRDAELRECARRYDRRFFNLLSIFIKWQQVLTKLTYAQHGSACRYNCTFH